MTCVHGYKRQAECPECFLETATATPPRAPSKTFAYRVLPDEYEMPIPLHLGITVAKRFTLPYIFRASDAPYFDGLADAGIDGAGGIAHDLKNKSDVLIKKKEAQS